MYVLLHLPVELFSLVTLFLIEHASWLSVFVCAADSDIFFLEIFLNELQEFLRLKKVAEWKRADRKMREEATRGSNRQKAKEVKLRLTRSSGS